MKKQDGGFQEFVILCEYFKSCFTNRYLIYIWKNILSFSVCFNLINIHTKQGNINKS